MDFICDWSDKTEISRKQFIMWLGIHKSKYYDWKERYGKANEHNAQVPRDFWLTDDEKEKIIAFHAQNPLNGYRRLTFMMIDQDVAYASSGTVYNILKKAGLLDRVSHSPSKKGTGFNQPSTAHKHWHVDISYINISGTFYYLCSVLDGYSRYITHWEIRESMTEQDVEIIIERAREKFPGYSPRIISDNGPQFISKDFKQYVRLSGMTHVRTSPYYPQSNGKIERWHKELKNECIRPKSPRTIDEAIRVTTGFIDDYNNHRLHSALGYITPVDKLNGHEQKIFSERDRKLEEARESRKRQRTHLRIVEQLTPVDLAKEVS